ncbi:hypothetical protein HOL34_03450 [bacterium]|jgi:hypothetical protein|nr:hypothetical protein [bacterium]MBT3903325.1 hypothetical protein [bacterium]MBT5345517.1 hypothetical protein [bacterium]MBT6131211.1 hypothetical protein [bacterium]MBT6529135.1 hypothetical protein [bacterium]
MLLVRKVWSSWKASLSMFWDKQVLGLLFLATLRGLKACMRFWWVMLPGLGACAVIIAWDSAYAFYVSIFMLFVYMILLILAVRPSPDLKDARYFLRHLKRLPFFMVVGATLFFLFYYVLVPVLDRKINFLPGVYVFPFNILFCIFYLSIRQLYSFFLLADSRISFVNTIKSIFAGILFFLVNLPGALAVCALSIAIFVASLSSLINILPFIITDYSFNYDILFVAAKWGTGPGIHAPTIIGAAVIALPFWIALSGAFYTWRICESLDIIGIGPE